MKFAIKKRRFGENKLISADFPKCQSPMSPKQASSMNALVLAFIGDAVQTLGVRTRLASSSDFKAGELHRLTSVAVNARAQAEKSASLADKLTDDERAVFMRARNSKSKNVAKNAAVGEYHMATALEAVIGFLYLTGQDDRIRELFAD
ncbi:MAG: ribonuclease III [Clostridiales bacterium]|nr:ribonuclease III [Clostridiales bacterium]